MQKFKISPHTLIFPTRRQRVDHNKVVAPAQQFERVNDTMHESYVVEAFRFSHSQRIQIATNIEHALSIISHHATTFLAINAKKLCSLSNDNPKTKCCGCPCL